MRIGVFGRGRLGSAVAREAGTAMVWQVGREAPPDIPVDVAIEVSSGDAVAARLEWAMARRTPLVIGSTGWELPDLEVRVGERIGVLAAPNFSITVALVLGLAKIVGRFAAADERRDPYIIEHHHARKKDAPSGTAKLLAATLLEACPRKSEWVIPNAQAPVAPHQISVSPVRAGVTYSSHVVGIDAPGEVLEIHHASRDASPYARGAITAAHWIIGKKGVFTMQDVARAELAPLFSGVIS